MSAPYLVQGVKRMGLLANALFRTIDTARNNLVQNLVRRTNDLNLAISSVKQEDKPGLLVELWPKMTKEEKPKLLLKVWKNHLPNAYYGYDWWLPLFEEVGFFSNCGAEKPEKEVTLFRGVEPDPQYLRGMSWTPFIYLAEIAVEHKSGPARVFTTKVKPEAILAIVQGQIISKRYKGIRPYTEFIIDYRKLNLEDIREYKN